MERPIVVGVDGSEPALTAVRWAAREADRRRAPLRLLHARPRLAPDHAVDERGRRWLVRAEAVAVAAAPGVPVDTAVVQGRPRSVLVEHSDDALLVVLGARGDSAASVVARAACPVVISRDVAETEERVVVGVDGTAASESAIGFAFEAASLRRARLRAVVAVTDLLVDDLRGRPRPVTDWTSLAEAQRRLLGECLAGWREKYPEVPVEPTVSRDSPVWSLVRSARRASLLVVGSHCHSAFTGRLLGSTSQALVLHTPCPLAVVRDGD